MANRRPYENRMARSVSPYLALIFALTFAALLVELFWPATKLQIEVTTPIFPMELGRPTYNPDLLREA